MPGFGLRPVRDKSGAPYNGAANMYSVPASDGTALYVGDPVIIAGSADANGVSTITRATAAGGGRITGVVVGFAPVPSATTDTGLRVGYRAASTLDNVLVADDPNLLFEAVEDQVGGALAAVDVGLNVDLIAAAGSNFTKRSGWMLDSSTKISTTAQMRLIGLSQRVNNTIGGTDAVYLVSIVQATETPSAGTTGV